MDIVPPQGMEENMFVDAFLISAGRVRKVRGGHGTMKKACSRARMSWGMREVSSSAELQLISINDGNDH
jgi:hypothetical protein